MNQHPHTSKETIMKLLLAPFAVGLIACGESAPRSTTNLAIDVQSLELAAVEEVTYGIRVRSAQGIVWEKSGLSSTRYGDGESALTYIGTCDAMANPHSVELTIENVRADGRDLIDPVDWQNPAPVGSPIRQIDITCVENADVPVVFDVTVLRAARQGFFDIMVEFDDIFCSAKVDCQDRLLHNGDGDRDATVVVGFACTAGENEQTFMHVSDLVVTCDDGDVLTAPVVFTMPGEGMTAGQHGPVLGTPNAVPGIFQWAVYEAQEQLTSDGVPLEKCFWNRAFGLDRGALAAAGLTTCSITALATASDALFDGVPGLDGAYPVVTFDVEVWDATDGLCDPNPLNGLGSGVLTTYIKPDSDLSRFVRPTGTYACGDAPVDSVQCPSPAAGTALTATADGDTLTIAYAGRPATTVTIPAGYTLGTSCCADGCCLGN